jgi:hypothetical protein
LVFGFGEEKKKEGKVIGDEQRRAVYPCKAAKKLLLDRFLLLTVLSLTHSWY